MALLGGWSGGTVGSAALSILWDRGGDVAAAYAGLGSGMDPDGNAATGVPEEPDSGGGTDLGSTMDPDG